MGLLIDWISFCFGFGFGKGKCRKCQIRCVSIGYNPIKMFVAIQGETTATTRTTTTTAIPITTRITTIVRLEKSMYKN